MASFATQITNIAAALHSVHTLIDATTGETYEHAQLIRGGDSENWLYSTANESSRLAKGILPHIPSDTETMAYISHDALPPGRKATYARFVATKRPHKTEKKRVHLTVGGNLIHYPNKVSTPSADLSTVKILLNNVISTPGTSFATFDLKDFLLGHSHVLQRIYVHRNLLHSSVRHCSIQSPGPGPQRPRLVRN
jgi:hypothetical protein